MNYSSLYKTNNKICSDWSFSLSGLTLWNDFPIEMRNKLTILLIFETKVNIEIEKKNI